MLLYFQQLRSKPIEAINLADFILKLFFQYFMKSFKYTENLREFYSEHTYE